MPTVLFFASSNEVFMSVSARHLRVGVCIIGLAAFTAACSSSDGNTPQASGADSVTQASDAADRAADAADRAAEAAQRAEAAAAQAAEAAEKSNRIAQQGLRK